MLECMNVWERWIVGWRDGGRVQMSEIRKIYQEQENRLGVRAGNPLPALSLFFDTIDERAENSQNWQMKIVVIAFLTQ